jgi:hypothetical protein
MRHIAACCALALACTAAGADPVTYDFTGYVTASNVGAYGDAITGTYTLDYAAAAPANLSFTDATHWSASDAGVPVLPSAPPLSGVPLVFSTTLRVDGRNYFVTEAQESLANIYNVTVDGNKVNAATNLSNGFYAYQSLAQFFVGGTGSGLLSTVQREGIYYNITSVTKEPSGVMAAPEMDPATGASAMTLLAGALLILSARRRPHA